MPVIDTIEEPDAFSIAMPFCKFGNIQNYRPTDKDHACNSVFPQILSVVSWLHSRGLVHRDIKPQNILVEDENLQNSKGVD